MTFAIPNENQNGAYCDACPFFCYIQGGPDRCLNPALKTEDIYPGGRSEECLHDFPHGGTVTIEAKRAGGDEK